MSESTAVEAPTPEDKMLTRVNEVDVTRQVFVWSPQEVLRGLVHDVLVDLTGRQPTDEDVTAYLDAARAWIVNAHAVITSGQIPIPEPKDARL